MVKVYTPVEMTLAGGPRRGGTESSGGGGVTPKTIKVRNSQGEWYDAPIVEVGKTFKNGKTSVRVKKQDGTEVWLNTSNMKSMTR